MPLKMRYMAGYCCQRVNADLVQGYESGFGKLGGLQSFPAI